MPFEIFKRAHRRRETKLAWDKATLARLANRGGKPATLDELLPKIDHNRDRAPVRAALRRLSTPVGDFPPFVTRLPDGRWHLTTLGKLAAAEIQDLPPIPKETMR